jgi:hypothetical protein
LASLKNAVSELPNSITPSQLSLLAEMGGEEYFEFEIADKIQDSVEKNAMTPAVARDFVSKLAARRSEFLATITQTRDGLQELGAKDNPLNPGSADASFIIPRDLFKNELGVFAKELKFLDQLVRDIGEAVTGKVEPVQLETLSSSVPTVAIAANAGIVYVIAKIVDKFLESWERIERIRKARAELADLGIRKSALQELTDQIKTTVNEVVDESVQLALEKYDHDLGRKNELEIALKQDMKRLFGQIERGLTIQFRVEAKDNADENEEKVFASLKQISCKLQFPKVTNEPILLTNGEILDDDADQDNEPSSKNQPQPRTKKRNDDSKPSK